ncbi:hypothetical protein Zm00014a_021258 [Zea mays]|uniref:Nucleolin n=5 Tax=Zea mays TaxID=4577 RepID=A0A3L6FTB0_MAIZE|nr:UBP1-associated protein 2A [Zea mays]PWZ38006.1 hypothetical protein Zm00014a_021258 [Zea mays]
MNYLWVWARFGLVPCGAIGLLCYKDGRAIILFIQHSRCLTNRKAVQMDTAAPLQLKACAGDAAEKLLLAVAAEGPICGVPDFKMRGKKSDELEPVDAGDEDDDGGDDGDEDGDFGEEGEEDVSEGEGYDNPKGNETKKQRGDPEENGEEDEEEPEDQEGGGDDDDDDDDDDENGDDEDDDNGDDDEEGVDEEDDDQDEDEEEDDDEDSLQPPKKRKK